jgi:hypothetical protein
LLATHAIAFFDRKLNRETRSDVSRRGRGIIAMVFLVCTAAALGLTIERLCRGHLLGAVAKALLPTLSRSILAGSPRILRCRLEVSGAGSIRLVGCDC